MILARAEVVRSTKSVMENNMKIAICGSIQFGKEMIEIKKQLEQFGHTVILPKDIEHYASGQKSVEGKWEKQDGDLFRNYWREINDAGAILVANITKNGIENYIGGSALIEMGYAHVLNKSIYLLNPIPKINYQDEIAAMQPVILDGDLSKIHIK